MPIRNFKDYHEDEQKDLLSHTDKKDFAEAFNGFRDPTQKLAKVGVDGFFDWLIKKFLKSAD